MGHYKGKIASWDVVNEPLADYDEFEDGALYRDHIWYKAMGSDYIATAFKEARKTDPKAQLFINEYGLEEDGDRWDAFLKLVTELKLAGVPIDGVGFQAHVYDTSDAVNPTVLRKHIQALAKIGLKSRISENDVLNDKGTAWQANQFASTLKACFEEPACVSYTTWGFSDRYDTFKDDDGSIQYGEDLPWDKNVQPTPAVQKMKDALK
jgi:endo-1,4-beta-xylanase